MPYISSKILLRTIIFPWILAWKKNFYRMRSTVTVMLVTSWCWWLYVGDNFRIFVTKKDVGDIFMHVGDMPMGHQHNYMPECDVGDRFVMLETWNSTWCQIQWRFLLSINESWVTKIGHQHHNTSECDVGDWYLMLVPNFWCWWRDMSPTSQTCHQHIWSPTSVTNIDVIIWLNYS